MKFLRKHWRGILISLALLVIGSFPILAWCAGSDIASPPRREVMEYHREYLDHPRDHGMVIERFTASDGTPCVFCTPDPSGNLGERGILIRKQLTDRGLALNPAGKIIGTLVLLHGRRGRKEDYLPIAERLCAAGFRCVIPDLPAHGDHPTLIATYGVREATLPARLLEEAAQKFSFQPQPAGLLGMSMGGSVAMHAADLPNAPWKALVIISSFDSFPTVIKGQASRYIGTTLGPLWSSASDQVYHWKSGIHLADIQPHLHARHLIIPTLVACGTADPVIPLTSAKNLFDSIPATTPKRWVEVPGANHDKVLVTAYPIYADTAEWMLRNVR